MNRKFTILLLTATLTFLMTNLMENWWSNRENNLFNNGRWIIGKDTGKYLFYTYEFMFDPLKQNEVKLNSRMGFQELLYHKAETAERRLQKLSFDMFVGGGTYIWVILRKDGQRAFACRLSYRKGYEAGFFTFNSQGEMVEYIPFPDGMPRINRSIKQSVELELLERMWVVNIDGQRVGSAPDPVFKNGHFGFRGSGVLRQKNNIGSIHIEWLNGGSLEREREYFEAPPTTVFHWMLILVCALLLVLLRLLRNWSMSCCLPKPAATHYIVIDFLLASFLIGVITQATVLTEIARLGLSLLLLEIFSFFAFAWFIRKHGQVDRIPRVGLVFLIAISCALTVFSLHRHGEWAGRKQYPAATAIAESYPSAFIQHPEPTPSLNEVVETEPFSVSFGQPFTTGDVVFDQQEILLEFVMPERTTFDICFQQQSFYTRGDPEGEPLPLQRRLIRLSTMDFVSGGISTQTGRQPEPFIPLKGNLLVGQLNNLSIRSTNEGLVVTLNGTESLLMGSISPIGYGETVLMTYEQPISVKRLEIHATNNQAAKKYILPLLGLFVFPLIALTGGLLFRILGSTTPVLTCIGTVAATFPLVSYFAVILFIEPVQLSLMPVDRLTILDFSIAAAVWCMMYWVPLHDGRIKQPAIPANLFLVGLIFWLVFLIWDIFLPPEHVLKTHFASRHSKPAGLVKSDQEKAPWYASNKRIGGNTYVWKQQFEGRWVSHFKKPGEIRAFVLGGSQAWGSGAESTRDTFSGLLHQRGRNEGWPVEVLNAGVNGAGVATVNDVFFGILPHYKPDIVILDIGLNDSASLKKSSNIEKQLSSFQEIAQASAMKGIDLILVHEPMSQEGPFDPHEALYSGLAEITREFGFQVVDTRPTFVKADPVEMIWWDVAHLSPRGHTLMADIIFPALKDSVEKRLAQTDRHVEKQAEEK